MKLKPFIKKAHAKVQPETPLVYIWDLLLHNIISLVPVVTKEDKLVGVIHEEDLLYKLIPDYREFFSEFLPDAPTFTDVEDKFRQQICKCAKDVLNTNII